ncbi:hypothetical protein, partial [Paraburkholderia bengalensis]|uniref:hypothetical protein n=1 Tax=Paraburkholderia bengalensis TaxID=2747562 RepID=UPI0030150103
PLQRKVGAAPHRGNACAARRHRGCQRKGKHTTKSAHATDAPSRMPAQRTRHTNASVRSNDRHRGCQRQGKHTTKTPARRKRKNAKNHPHYEDIKKEPVASTQDAFTTVT